jgi:hypothetical protein
MAATTAEPANSVITPDNSALIVVDHPSQMASGVHDGVANNSAQPAPAARPFQVPTPLPRLQPERSWLLAAPQA